MTTTIFKAEDWRVRGQLRHEGLIYGPADPLPPLTLEEARRYEAEGVLVHQGEEAKPTVYQAASALLRMNDLGVLRAVLAQRPPVEVLEEMASQAKRVGRSIILTHALDAMLVYAQPAQDAQP